MPQVEQLGDEVVLRRSDGVVDAVVDGETVLMAPTDYSYHGLDPVGARIWALLDVPRTLAELVDTLVREYDVTPEVCRADVVAFAARMREAGLLQLG